MERKGITVMMLGFLIGFVLIAVFVIFVMLFYEGDLLGGILNGMAEMIDIFGEPMAQG